MSRIVAYLKIVIALQLLTQGPLAGVMQVGLHLKLAHELSIVSVACVYRGHPEVDLLPTLKCAEVCSGQTLNSLVPEVHFQGSIHVDHAHVLKDNKCFGSRLSEACQHNTVLVSTSTVL